MQNCRNWSLAARPEVQELAAVAALARAAVLEEVEALKVAMTAVCDALERVWRDAQEAPDPAEQRADGAAEYFVGVQWGECCGRRAGGTGRYIVGVLLGAKGGPSCEEGPIIC